MSNDEDGEHKRVGEDIWEAFERVLAQYPKDILRDLPTQIYSKEFFTVQDLEREIKIFDPSDTYSFVKGFQSACLLFGTWNNGEVTCGVKTKFKEIEKAIQEFTREQE